MKMIELEWGGKKFQIVESEAFEVGERIEEIVTLAELASMGDKPKFRKLARAYAEMINFAGGKASPQDVYKAFMAQIKGDNASFLMEAISALVEILMDGADDAGGGGEGSDEKKSSSSKDAISSPRNT